MPKERRRIFVLNNPNAPRLSPELAQEIGLPESIILLQLEFWISISDHCIDGRWWTYQSIRNIQRTFVFWSIETINRTIKSLINKGLIETGNFNKKAYDKTRWFALDQEAINKLESVQILDTLSYNKTDLSQNETPLSNTETGKSQNVTTIPETTPENTSKKSSSRSAFKIYEDNIGRLTSVVSTDIICMLEEFTEERVCDAIEIAVKAGAPNLRYIRGILSKPERSFRRNGQRETGVIDEDKFIRGKYSHVVQR